MSQTYDSSLVSGCVVAARWLSFVITYIFLTTLKLFKNFIWVIDEGNFFMEKF